jgi:hypothetical protein
MKRKLIQGSWISDSGVFIAANNSLRDSKNRPQEYIDHKNPASPAEWVWVRTWHLYSALLVQLNSHGTKHFHENKQAVLQQLFALEEVMRFCRQEVEVEQGKKEPDQIMYEEHKRSKQWESAPKKKGWK